MKKLLEFVSSRRAQIIFAHVLIFVAYYWVTLKTNGFLDHDIASAFVVLLVGWIASDSIRRHKGPILESRRMLSLMIGQIVVLGAGLLKLDWLPSDALAELAWPIAGLLVGDGLRRHEAKPPEVV